MINEEKIFKDFILSQNPQYFLLDEESKVKYRIKNIDLLLEEASRYFYEDILGLVKNPDVEMFDFPYESTSKETLQYNVFTSFIKGVGKNKFHLNEFLGDDEDILSFKTLYDYDFNDHEFQESCSEERYKEKSEDYTKEEYTTMRLYANWARGNVSLPKTDDKNSFHYMILNSIYSEIYFEVEDIAYDYIDELIPHDINTISGEPNEDGYIQMSFEYKEKDSKKNLSNEKLLSELNSKNYEILKNLFNEIKLKMENKKHNAIWVYKSDNGYGKYDEDDPSLTYVFSDIDVIKNIRFEHWQEDIEKYYSEDFGKIIENYKTEYKEKFKMMIKKEYDLLVEKELKNNE